MTKKINQFHGRYWFLSNFYECKVRYGDIDFNSLEHAYQAAKTKSSKDRARIARCATASMAKKIGRNVKMRRNWEKIKVRIMKKLLHRKFEHKNLRDKLLATGSAELVEGNTWYDIFWGVDIDTGKGKNWLGRLLMEVRDEIREDVEDE